MSTSAEAQTELPEEPKMSESEAAGRLINEMDKVNVEHRSAPPAETDSPFTTPPSAEVQLTAAEQAYSDAFDAADKKASAGGKGDIMVRDELARAGLTTGPPSAEEVEAAEQQRLARLREEAAATQQPSTSSGLNKTGHKSRPITPRERAKPGYDHERDPSNPQPF